MSVFFKAGVSLLGLSVGTVGVHVIKQNYGPTELPQYKPGDTVVVEGDLHTVVGYSGHKGDVADKLKLVDHEIWITEDYALAQGYASEKGKVAIIAAKTIAPLGSSRYENMHAPHLPSKEHGYKVIAKEVIHANNDARFGSCLKRFTSNISLPKARHDSGCSTEDNK